MGRTEGGSYGAHNGWALPQPSVSKILHATILSGGCPSHLPVPALGPGAARKPGRVACSQVCPKFGDESQL